MPASGEFERQRSGDDRLTDATFAHCDQPLARTGYYSLTDGQKLTQEFLAAALPEEGVDARCLGLEMNATEL